MRKIAASESTPIFLGHLAENEATIVEFDVSGWENLFGAGGQFSVWAKRNGDAAFYPCESSYSDGKVIWYVKNSDVSVLGQGMCGLIYRFGESGNAKSAIYSTYVDAGITGGDEVPASYTDWVSNVLEAAESVNDAVSHYPYIDGDSGRWMVWDTENGAFTDTGISANGNIPQKGVDYFTASEIAEIVQAAAENVDLSPLIEDLQLDEIYRTVTDTEKSVWNGKYEKPVGGIPSGDMSAAVQASLALANSAVQAETDPTVPAWAKSVTKPTYTAQEVGALPSDTQFVAPSELAAVTAKIPAQAGSSNQLADKDFVNSSVQTATANFRGNWNAWADVPTDARSYPLDYAGTRTPTTNDYMVVVDASGVPYTDPQTQAVTYPYEGTWRFKYGGVWATDGKNGWNAEYQVNETPMTAAQIAALNSNITASLVTTYSAHVNNGGIHVTATDKTNWNAKIGASGGNITGSLTIGGNRVLTVADAYDGSVS